MGIPTNIKTLLSGNVVEWARIEFKETWDPEASLKTICAFANDIDNWGGGYLIIGVEDKDGKPTNLKGVSPEKIDAYLKDLLNKCKLIQPEYMPITEVIDYENKKFIVIWAPGGSVRPYSSPKIISNNNNKDSHLIFILISFDSFNTCNINLIISFSFSVYFLNIIVDLNHCNVLSIIPFI